MITPLPEFYCPYSEKCYECCLDTEMTLSEEDITRVEQLGYKIEEFLDEKDGFMALRNIDNHCIFLKDESCSIYENRPQGCRFYPLIYDFDVEDIVIDNLCEHQSNFDLEIYRPLFDAVQVFVYNLLGERETRMRKTMEKEIRVEVKETKNALEDPLTEEMRKLERDKEKIESLIEQAILDPQDEQVGNLEEALKSEMREIEEDIEALEKGIKEDLASAEEYIKITEESINSELKDLEKRRKNFEIEDK
ncbi:MAG: YkgJ family cysteine cluster protein [Candidatus Heimdallarchaeota archaeon]|nr:YkgJ family cysteine cluster protein [Candidatus Heimdallarchaeota archaeon]